MFGKFAHSMTVLLLLCSFAEAGVMVLDNFDNGDISLMAQPGSTSIRSKQDVAEVFSGQREISFGSYAKGSVASIDVQNGSLALDSVSGAEQLKMIYPGKSSTIDLVGKTIGVDFGYIRRKTDSDVPFSIGVSVSSGPDEFTEASHATFAFAASNNPFSAAIASGDLAGEADLSRVNRIAIFVNGVVASGVELEVQSIYVVPEPGTAFGTFLAFGWIGRRGKRRMR